MEQTAPKVDEALDRFMHHTAKNNVAVIIPLFGFWNDIPDNPVNGEVLQMALRRIYSNVHYLNLVFVANPETIPASPDDPNSVANILLSKARGGNVKNVPVPRNATYTDYVREGLEYALQETNCSFFIVINPWVMIQEGGIDAIVDRANFGDNAKVISGFDLSKLEKPEAFDYFRATIPTEQWDLAFDFVCMPRFAAEMIDFDPEYKTHGFLQKDIWQIMFKKGFGVISSQRVPIFVFEFPWENYEPKETHDYDRAHFIKKWGFDPGIE